MNCLKCPFYMKFKGSRYEETPCADCTLTAENYVYYLRSNERCYHENLEEYLEYSCSMEFPDSENPFEQLKQELTVNIWKLFDLHSDNALRFKLLMLKLSYPEKPVSFFAGKLGLAPDYIRKEFWKAASAGMEELIWLRGHEHRLINQCLISSREETVKLLRAFRKSVKILLTVNLRYPDSWPHFKLKMQNPEMSYLKIGGRLNCCKQTVHYHLKKIARLFPELSVTLINQRYKTSRAA